MGKSKKRAASGVRAGDETKRPVVEDVEEEECEDSDVDVSSEEEEDEDDEDAFKEINVDFEFFDPKEIDFHGLKALLGTYIDGGSLDTSELADTIIAQATVGTVLKTAEDEDPIGLVTALNLKRYQKLESLAQVKRFLLSKAKDQAMKDNIDKAWKADGTGLLLTERLINVPPQLAPPLMQAIFDEIEWATEDEPTQELRDSYKFKQYLIVTRVYVDPWSASGGASSSKSQTKKPKVAGAEPLLVYARPEDEAFHQLCTWSFNFRTEKEVGKDELQPWRLAMLVPASAVPAMQKMVVAAVAAPTT